MAMDITQLINLLTQGQAPPGSAVGPFMGGGGGGVPSFVPTASQTPGEDPRLAELKARLLASYQPEQIPVPEQPKAWQIILGGLGDVFKNYGAALNPNVNRGTGLETLRALRDRREQIMARNELERTRAKTEGERAAIGLEIGQLTEKQQREARAAEKATERAEEARYRKGELESRQGFEERMQTQAQEATATQKQLDRDMEWKIRQLQEQTDRAIAEGKASQVKEADKRFYRSSVYEIEDIVGGDPSKGLKSLSERLAAGENGLAIYRAMVRSIDLTELPEELQTKLRKHLDVTVLPIVEGHRKMARQKETEARIADKGLSGSDVTKQIEAFKQGRATATQAEQAVDDALAAGNITEDAAVSYYAKIADIRRQEAGIAPPKGGYKGAAYKKPTISQVLSGE